MRIFYSPDYVLSDHAFDTTRKAGWVAEALSTQPLSNVELTPPPSLTAEDLGRVHDALYVQAVRTGTPRALAETQGFRWDVGLWRMTCASNGGAVAAALDALQTGRSGSLSSGLHHARRDRGLGFCTFNGLALAAFAALETGGAKSVLILDFDAHCGGGTYSLIRDEPRIRQIDVSTSDFDHYDPEGTHRLTLVDDASAYWPALNAALEEAERGSGIDLCLYNAGMDPFEESPEGGLSGIKFELLAERERLVFAWARRHGVPIAFVLAGGYVQKADAVEQREQLVKLHLETIQAATS